MQGVERNYHGGNASCWKDFSWWQDIDVEGLGAHFHQNFTKLEGIIKTGWKSWGPRMYLGSPWFQAHVALG